MQPEAPAAFTERELHKHAATFVFVAQFKFKKLIMVVVFKAPLFAPEESFSYVDEPTSVPDPPQFGVSRLNEVWPVYVSLTPAALPPTLTSIE